MCAGFEPVRCKSMLSVGISTDAHNVISLCTGSPAVSACDNVVFIQGGVRLGGTVVTLVSR